MHSLINNNTCKTFRCTKTIKSDSKKKSLRGTRLPRLLPACVYAR